MIHLTVADCAKLVQAELAHAIQPEALEQFGCHRGWRCCGLCCGRCPICCQIVKALTGEKFQCSCVSAIHRTKKQSELRWMKDDPHSHYALWNWFGIKASY